MLKKNLIKIFLRFSSEKPAKHLSVIDQVKKLQQLQEKQRTEQEEFREGLDQLVSPKLPEVKIQSEQKETELYVDDYTKVANKTQVDERDENYVARVMKSDGTFGVEWVKNSSQQLDLRNNPLAQRVLTEGKIDLKDERVVVTSMKSMGTIGAIEGVDNLKEVSLGRVEVLPKNAIHLKDVDVENIPDDLDIELQEKYKELRAIGVETTDGNIEGKLENQIIEDITLEEVKDKHLFKFEQDFFFMDRVELLRYLVRQIPSLILGFAFVTTIAEVYYLRQEVHRMEQQEWQPYQKLTEQLQQEMLVSDPRFARSKILGL